MERQVEERTKELQITNEKFSKVFHCSPYPIAIASLEEGRLLAVNESFLRLSGYQFSEVIGHTSEELSLWQNFQDRDRIREILLTQHKVKNQEQVFQNKMGNLVTVIFSAEVIAIEDKNCILWIGIDITARKKAEESLVRLNSLLQAQKEVAIDGILAINEQGAITLYNQKFCAMWDIPLSLVKTDTNIHGFLLVLEEVFGQSCQLSECIEYGYDHPSEPVSREFALDDGRVFECYSAPIQVEGGTFYGMVWYFRDVTERVHAADVLRQAKDRAETANRAKAEFLSRMSHEVRTPLNAILGMTEILLTEPNISEEQESLLTIVSNSGQHLLTLVSDILEMSRIDSGKANINRSIFELYGFILEVQNMMRLRAENKQISLNLEYSADSPLYIYSDSTKLKQILLNLISNAIKFTQTGSVTIKVALLKNDASAYRKRVQFEVEDTGVGIEQAELDLIFEAFTQAGAGRKSGEGTGLGLAISQNFVYLLGGNLAVESVLGKGTKFTFAIPVELKNIEHQLLLS